MSDTLPLPDSRPSPGPHPTRPRIELDTSQLPPAPDYAGGPDARRAGGYGSYGGYGAPAFGEEPHLTDYVRVLYKRRWVVLTVFALVFGSVAVYTLAATPIYQARAQILIENEEANVVTFQQVVEENRRTQDYYQTQYRILQSRALARRTLDQARLWDHDLFHPERHQPGALRSALNWIRDLWPRASAEALGEARAENETDAQAKVIDEYLRRLQVTPIRNSRLVDVAFLSPDPQLSAQVANAHASAYIDQNLEFKFLASKEAADWLAQRMGEQRKQVEAAEQALQRYREQTGAVSLEDRQNIVVQRLADLNAAVTRARTERIEKEAVYNQVRELASANSAALDTVPAILNNLFIQQQKAELAALQRQQAQMAEKLGERHPDMIKVATAIEATQRRIDGEVQKIVAALRNDYQAALANERSLQAALDRQREEAQQLNRLAIQYGTLQRDAEANRQLFQGLLQRTRETDIAADLRSNNIRIVDAAEPPRRPSSPNRGVNLLLGLFGGLMLGVGLGFFFEYLDGRIKHPDEIRAQLKLPCLALIPVVRPSTAETDPLITARSSPHGFCEAFKALRTSVLFSSADEGSKILLVTSTGPGEGKTLVATNLATALAQSGQRVLLVDCDMRRPRVHAIISCNQEPGLSNVMVGNAKASDAVRKTVTQNLWVLPAGKNPPNPAELIGSKRFGEFFKNLREHFDFIVLDSPPIMAVTDAVVAAHGADGVLYVIGAEMIHRNAAKHAIVQLETVKARLLGAVLNRVSLDRHAYYYSHYYSHRYQHAYLAQR